MIKKTYLPLPETFIIYFSLKQRILPIHSNPAEQTIYLSRILFASSNKTKFYEHINVRVTKHIVLKFLFNLQVTSPQFFLCTTHSRLISLSGAKLSNYCPPLRGARRKQLRFFAFIRTSVAERDLRSIKLAQTYSCIFVCPANELTSLESRYAFLMSLIYYSGPFL